MTLPLPRAQSTYVDASGRPTTEFYKWLQSLERDAGGDNTALALAIRQIAEKLGSVDGSVAGIPDVYPGLSADTSLVGIGGQIQVSGTLASGEALVGLASVADSGAGELLAVERDTFGRVSGSRSVLPSDIPSPLWTFLVDPDGNYLTDADGALLRAPGIQVSEPAVFSSTITYGGIVQASVQRGAANTQALAWSSANQRYEPQANIFLAGASGAISLAPAVPTGQAAFNLGITRSGDGPSFLDFYSDATAGNDARIIRNGGANGTFVVSNNGTGALIVNAVGAAPLSFRTNNTQRFSISSGGQADFTGAVFAATYGVSAQQVVGARRTGWAAATGTATRTTFDTTTVTTAQLAERVKALLDDLIAHGLIGA